MLFTILFSSCRCDDEHTQVLYSPSIDRTPMVDLAHERLLLYGGLIAIVSNDESVAFDNKNDTTHVNHGTYGTVSVCR